MAIQIIKENTNISLINTTDNAKIASFDLFSFGYVDQGSGVYFFKDSANSALVNLTEAVDDNEEAFADAAAFVSYLENASRGGANLGTSLQLDNIELINTGSHLKMLNRNTGETTFMVQQRVNGVLGTTSVYYVEQTTEIQVEDSSDAYQPYTTHTSNGV